MSYQEFRNNLKVFTKLDQDQNKYQKQLNKIKNRKTEIKPQIINYMNNTKIKNTSINSNYELKLKETSQYSYISKNHIESVLKKHLNNDLLVDKISKDIYKSRNKSINLDINIVKKNFI